MIVDKFPLSLITAILGFGIWNIQRFMEDRKNPNAKALKQDNLVRAIYAEIDFNTTDMEIFLTKSPSLSVLRQAMAERDDLIPHITDARHTWFYSSRISEMHVISDDLMSQIVQFYGLLEKIKMQVEGLNAKSYGTLSSAGRFKVVVLIRNTAEEAWLCGKELLRELEHAYTKLKLVRYQRPELVELETLRTRMMALETRIEAVKTASIR